MKHLLLVLVVVLSAATGLAQGLPEEADLSTVADDLLAVQEADLNYDELYENLAQLLSNPLDINTATCEELRFLNIFSESQLQNLVQYRQENGPLLSLYELQIVEGFDPETLVRVTPFLKVQDRQRISHKASTYLVSRIEKTLETKHGFDSSLDDRHRFMGSPAKLYTRFRSNRTGDYSLGFTVEKDDGEKMSWRPMAGQFGFDYVSAHFQIQNRGNLKNLVIGDYQCQFGQGLMLGGAYGMGKGAETITTVRRSTLGLLPYTSVNESAFLRGAGATFAICQSVWLTGFYSNTRRDATASEDDSVNAVSSLQATGFHRNTVELEKRKTIGEQNMGAVVHITKRALDAGLMFNQINFDKVIKRNSTVYNLFDFEGTQNRNIGGFLNYTFYNFSAFGEFVKTQGGGRGFVAGLLGSLNDQLDVSVVYRRYDKDYHVFYANAFTESSTPQNESGMYWGWKYRWNRRYNLTGYIDLFRFPWLRFRSYTPSHGHEWLLRLNYQPSKHILFFIQTREERKVLNDPVESTRYETTPVVKRNYWIQCTYEAGVLSLKTRVQVGTARLSNHTSHGFALLQDISVAFWKMKITARHAVFDTDDFDTRQYAYENDVWMAYSMPAYYGVGIRNYCMLEYKASRKLSFWFRFARTRYTDRTEMGSGVDALPGNTRNDIKLQVRIKI